MTPLFTPLLRVVADFWIGWHQGGVIRHQRGERRWRDRYERWRDAGDRFPLR